MIENEKMKCFNNLSEKLNFLTDLPNKFSIESGREINLVSNIYPINFTSDSPTKLYQYQVTLNPKPENINIASKIICSVLFPDSGPFQSNPDWNSLIYILDEDIIFSPQGNLEKKEPTMIKEENVEYEICISITKEILLKDDNISDFTKAANAIIQKCFVELGFSSLDENFINNTVYKDVDHLRIVEGFQPKTDIFLNKLSLFIDTASRIDRKGTLYDFIISGVGNASRRQTIEDSLSKMTYVTRHLVHQKTVRILKINWNSKAQTEPINENSSTTFADYFMSQYDFYVKPDDPIVEALCNGKTILLPASALSQIGITEIERSDSRLMSSVSDVLFLDPSSRKRELESFILSLSNDNKTAPLLKNFGLSIGDPFVIKGRILDSPELVARDRNDPCHQFIRLKPNHKMSFDVSKVLAAVPSLIRSVPLIIAPESLESQVRDIFLHRFLKIAVDVGLNFYNPEVRYLNSYHVNSLKGEIFNYIRKNGTPSFIIIFCCEKNLQRYDALKQLLMTNLGIPSQFILAESIFNRRVGVDDLLINVAFRITAITGGIPYYVPLPLSKTLIIGVAGYRSETEINGKISVYLSASIDQTCARFYSDMFVLDSDGILSENQITKFVTSAKEKFQDVFRVTPSRLIVYRLLNDVDINNKSSKDIISYEDQILKVSQSELPFFKNSFNSLNELEKGNNSSEPKSFTFIVVQKSQTLRLFYPNEDGIENPPPGTIISDNESGLADFYLVSNYTKFGTAMPVRYIVLNQVPQQIWSNEQLAQLTYYLSFNYCGFPGALRLPSPLTNALKLATFSHQHLDDTPLSPIFKENIVNFV